jgi:hypothetical protein
MLRVSNSMLTLPAGTLQISNQFSNDNPLINSGKAVDAATLMLNIRSPIEGAHLNGDMLKHKNVKHDDIVVFNNMKNYNGLLPVFDARLVVWNWCDSHTFCRHWSLDRFPNAEFVMVLGGYGAFDPSDKKTRERVDLFPLFRKIDYGMNEIPMKWLDVNVNTSTVSLLPAHFKICIG